MEKEKCKNITTIKKITYWRNGNGGYGCRNHNDAVYSKCK